MKKILREICIAALLAAGPLISAGCFSVTRENRDVYYDYDYYPEYDVYYDTEEHLYYWREDGHWVSGPVLPPRYVVREHHYRHIHVRNRHPWEDHPVEHPGEHLNDHD